MEIYTVARNVLQLVEMTMMNDHDPVTNCCGAPFWYPGYPDSDICSRCLEHAGVEEEEDNNE